MSRTTEGEKMTAHTPGEPCTTVVNCCQLHKAAPDMLAALKELVAEFDEASKKDEQIQGHYGLVETGGIVLARAALAKAEAK